MTEHNHRRGTHAKMPTEVHTVNGRPWGIPDKSMQGWNRRSVFADKMPGASIGNDFVNGHRGMARSAKGAKKYVNSRVRFHDKATLKRLTAELDEE